MSDPDKVPGAWAHPDGRLFLIALFGLVFLFTALWSAEERWLLAGIGIALVTVGVAGMLLREYSRRKRGQ